jgi:subtilisin family serine protease
MKWLEMAEAKRAIDKGTGKGVKVAVIDSGVETSHPKLKGLQLVDDIAVECDGAKLRIVDGKGEDVFGHGTAVSWVIRQLAPEAQIGSIRVLGHDNTSKTRIIHRAALEALDRGYNIINCSFGCGVQRQVLKYKDWVDEAYLKGVHVVAACDNLDFASIEWPAYFPTSIAVNMARCENDAIFYYQRGTLVEFAARGVDITLPWMGGDEIVVTGSSFAAPRMSAMVARLISVEPQLTPLEVKSILQHLAEPWTRQVAADNVLSATAG